MNSPTSISPAEEIADLERKYLLQNYARYPLALHRGDGVYVYDLDGRRYLDLISGIGVNALGHNHPRIINVIREQAALLIHSSNLYYHEYQGPLAKVMAEASGLQRSFFCNSGTEAIEGAIKMMRSHGRHIGENKFEMISLDNSFHGRTMGAISLTGQPKYRKDFEPLLSGVKFVPANDIAALESAFSERTCGVVIEAIQGEGGIYAMSGGYLRKARELADRYDALLVFDEIQCGVGRTGTYFAYQLLNPPLLPDITITAKPFGCGLPLGVVIANERGAQAIKTAMHGTTFGGGPLACRVALEFFDILGGLLPAIQRVGDYFRGELRTLGREFTFIKEVRGEGLMIGVELEKPWKDLVQTAMSESLLVNVTHDIVLRMLPPYILTEAHVDEAIAALKRVFAAYKP